jgi:hypothetical protein
MTSTKKRSKSVNNQPAPATPIKAVAVLEEDEESTDLLPQESIRSEVNLLSFPFFALSRKDAQKRMTTEYRTTLKRGEERLDVSWIVSANPRYGYPRPFDRQVHRAIEQIISEMKPPLQNPVPIGSLYRIAQLLNLQRSGRLYNNIKAALQRIVTTSIESKGTYYDKGKRRWREATFHLYDKVFFTGEELDNGEIADDNYLVLDSWYLDNINNRYVRPLDYTYYRSLQSPIASRLYELLGVKFYGMGKNPYIRYRYSTLCQLLPVTRYRRVSKAKEILNPAHEELRITGFFDRVDWNKIEGETRDWYITYYPGTRARQEIEDGKRGNNHLALPPPEDSEPVSSTAAPQPTASDADDTVVSALQKFGISKNQAQKLAKEYPKDYILEKLEMVQWLVDMKSPLVAKNPAGFARRAIEEDYPAPPHYKSKAQRAEETERKAQELQRLKNCTICEGTGYYQVAENTMSVCQHNDRRAPQKPKPDATIEPLWKQVLESLRGQTPASTYETRVKDTKLLGLDGQTAVIGVADKSSKEWLERSLYRSIVRTLEQVLGQPVNVEFVVSPETS